MSEQKADQVGVESGSLDAAPAVSVSTDTPSEAAKAVSVEAPKLVPEQGETAEAVAVESPKAEMPKAEMPKAEMPKAEAFKVEAPKIEAPKPEAPHAPGKIMIMSSGDRAWERRETGSQAQTEQSQPVFGKRRIGALAAVVALAALAGALGGAAATVGLTHFAVEDTAPGGSHAIEASVARIEADIQTLKLSVEHTAKIGMSQFNKTSERLDKVEKAQIEPAAKLAKLNEAVDKLRAAPVAAPVPVAAAPAAPKETTGSIAPTVTANATAAATPPKVEIPRLPTVDGWAIRDVGHGGALIESRRGIFEVYAGDYIPGLGRIDAVRKQDGHWVVVTAKGLIVAR